MDDDYGPSMQDFERSTIYYEGGNIGTMGGGKMGDIQKRLAQISDTPTERFLKRLVGVSYSLESDDIVINKSSIERMFEYAKKGGKIETLNPLGFVLGYYVSSSGRIDEKKLKVVLKAIKDMDGIMPPDIIRYSRYWIKDVGR